jgi:hypothetical protein
MVARAGRRQAPGRGIRGRAGGVGAERGSTTSSLHEEQDASIASGPVAGGEPSELDGAIKRYYEAHASERGGQCLAPYIDGFTRTQVVEDGPERLVVDVRYLYRDRYKDNESGVDGNAMTGCINYGTRRFVLARSDDALTVEQMSGPRRN